MPRCAELQLDAESASAWDYCVYEKPASHNWFEAMAACRDFGGELVSLEWRAKIEEIQKRLSGSGMNLSSGVRHRSSAVLFCMRDSPGQLDGNSGLK